MAMKPITMSQPEEFLTAWNEAAKSKEMTLSQWVAECCNEKLPAKVRKSLPDRETVGRKPAHIAMVARFNRLAKAQQTMLLEKAAKLFGHEYSDIEEIAADWDNLSKFKRLKFSSAVELLAPDLF